MKIIDDGIPSKLPELLGRAIDARRPTDNGPPMRLVIVGHLMENEPAARRPVDKQLMLGKGNQ